ncbi:amidohydrolase family protein [Natrialbaceae archaeon A-gly3]
MLGHAAGAGTAGVIGATGRIEGAEPATGEETDASAGWDDPYPDLPLVDAHTHLIPAERLGREPLTADQLVAWMDAHGVDRAVVLPLDSPEAYPVTAPTWWVLDRVDAHPDRLIPFCVVDPRRLVYGEDVLEERIELSVEQGARGLGELKPGLRVDDSRLHTVYELCSRYDLPIIFHADDKAMLDDVGYPALEEVIASYPDIDFVGHAMGWWAHISADVTENDLGGYPDRPVEPGGRVPELLATYDNVYGDLSGGSGWNALARDPSYAQEFLERHHNQLIFGTDYLFPGHEVPNFQLFERFDLERDAWANIRHRNIESLLR